MTFKIIIIQRKIYSYSEFNDVALVLKEKRSLQKRKRKLQRKKVQHEIDLLLKEIEHLKTGMMKRYMKNNVDHFKTTELSRKSIEKKILFLIFSKFIFNLLFYRKTKLLSGWTKINNTFYAINKL